MLYHYATQAAQDKTQEEKYWENIAKLSRKEDTVN